MKRLLLSAALLATAASQASTVAIIDSGTDMLHMDIAPKAWINENEIARNNRDEDRNGYVDDFYGWNFAEGNHKVIDYKYLGTLTYDVRRFFETQQKMILGVATDAEIQWMKEKIEDQEFLKELQVYGNFMHGTHVAGIAAKDAVDAKIMAIKLIPTEVGLPGSSVSSMFPQKNDFLDGMGMFLFKLGLEKLAKAQMEQMEKIAAYMNSHKVDIANGSFGTGYKQMKTMITMLFKSAFGREPEDYETEELVGHFFDVLLKEGEHFVNKSRKTLFVFAAGNDGTNNDKYPTSPTNIDADNVISVAASVGNAELASFTNFGASKVDVAAPGVAVNSTVPGNQYLRVSGTSQAAPYVAGMAAQIKDANPELRPIDIKTIIMKTVDLKSWLIGKVATAGVVNTERAVKAAELSRTQALAQAINQARNEVMDAPTQGVGVMKSNSTKRPMKGIVLPLPSQFVVK